jgi:hypothetical protein
VASALEYSCALGAQINFGDLTPHLTYAWHKVTKKTQNAGIKIKYSPKVVFYGLLLFQK